MRINFSYEKFCLVSSSNTDEIATIQKEIINIVVTKYRE